MIKGLLIVGLSLLSALLYYLGGEKGWNTKYRDFGCPSCALLTLWLLGITAAWWVWVLGFGIMFGAMTLSGKKKGEDSRWWNWLILGAFYAFSAIPFVLWGSVPWLGFIIRIIVLGLITMFWSERFSSVLLEAGGRGFWFNISLILFKL